MSQVCACGQPATHRTRWNPYLEMVEPIPSRSPSRCLGCARRDALIYTRWKLADIDRAKDFYGGEKHTFKTATTVPHEWYRLVKQAARRHPEAVNPGGLVEVFKRANHIIVDLYPPKEKPATWTPVNCLYLLRYLTRLPLVFCAVPIDESPSPHTWRASREQWSGTVKTPVLSASATPTPCADATCPEDSQ